MTPVFINNFRNSYKCTVCPEHVQSERKMCPRHLAYARQMWYKHVAKCRIYDQCINCDNKAVAREQRCRSCKEHNRKRGIAWYYKNAKYKAGYDRARKEKWVKQGLCPKCAEHREIQPGRHSCSACLYRPS